jgi:hypothetical protein
VTQTACMLNRQRLERMSTLTKEREESLKYTKIQ